jgi:beta-phosphoglucomutase-like phosphatase (HAD superfamily)
MSVLLIFDCDRVLIDSEALEHAVGAELLGPFGFGASVDQLLRRFVGDMYEVVFAELKRELPAGLPDKLRMKLESTGLADHFAPHIFSTARTGHRPSAGAGIVIEDSRHGIAGARAAGMGRSASPAGAPRRRAFARNSKTLAPRSWCRTWTICHAPFGHCDFEEPGVSSTQRAPR